MRSATNDKQSRDNKDSKGGRVRQHIEAPPMIRSQGSIEPVHLDQSERTESEFEIRGATPDGCHNSKDNPAFDIASVLHAVVQSDRNGGCVDEDEECKDEKSPTFPAMMPSKRKLR
jgi:hypothetical protein